MLDKHIMHVQVPTDIVGVLARCMGISYRFPGGNVTGEEPQRYYCFLRFLVGGVGGLRERICAAATNNYRAGDDTFDPVTGCSNKGLNRIISWERIAYFCF